MSTQTQTTAPSEPRHLTGTLIGTVTSDKRDQTRTVSVNYQVRHPKYGKYLHRHTRYQVHDPKNEAKKGDRVEIAPCRPISKTKSWRLVRVIEAAPAVIEHVKEVAGLTGAAPKPAKD
jgi:small subunit ribosomal protein S17